MYKQWMLVLIGGGIGAIARVTLMLVVATPNALAGFNVPIFVANMTAAFMIGLASGLAAKGGIITSNGKLFFSTGIMGGLSTFSTLVWGAVTTLADPALRAMGITYLVVSMVIGFLLVQLGLWIGQRVIRGRLKAESLY